MKYHLTPEKLLGPSLLPEAWAAAKIAFVCFTPFPNGFKPYVKAISTERYFLHSPCSEVRLCQFEDIPFLVISEVYGFAVGATTMEELIHHGIQTILAVGYAGAFNGSPVGQSFIAKDTMADLPLAAHYGVDAYVRSEPTIGLYNFAKLYKKEKGWGEYSVWNGNSLYRESQVVVDEMKSHGCDLVNMDVLSVYAVTAECAKTAPRPVSCIYFGTITDSDNSEDEGWDSDLMEAVNRNDAHPHDQLVKFLVEEFMVALENQG